MTKTQKRSPQATAGNADDAYSLKLWFDPDGQPAGTNNCAQVKAMLDDYVIPTQVQLSIIKSSAVFANGLSQITQWTDSTGNFTPPVPFTDTVAEPGSMTAKMLTDVNGDPFPNGPTDTEPFTFIGYELSLAVTLDGQPGSGQDADVCTATVTVGGKPADTIVRFTVDQPAAKFVNSDPTTPRSIDVPTSGGTAKVSFVDNNFGGETVTITACLPQHPEAKPKAQPFTFGPSSREFYLQGDDGHYLRYSDDDNRIFSDTADSGRPDATCLIMGQLLFPELTSLQMTGNSRRWLSGDWIYLKPPYSGDLVLLFGVDFLDFNTLLIKPNNDNDNNVHPHSWRPYIKRINVGRYNYFTASDALPDITHHFTISR